MSDCASNNHQNSTCSEPDPPSRDQAIKIQKICTKCKKDSSSFLYRQEWCCWDCFQTSFRKKFKGCVVKGRRFKNESLDMIAAYSGGISSRSMVELLRDVACSSRKKVLMKVNIVHIDESAILNYSFDKRLEIINNIKESVSNLPFQCHVYHLEDIYNIHNLNERPELYPDDVRTQKVYCFYGVY
jgi:hypothetical protein